MLEVTSHTSDGLTSHEAQRLLGLHGPNELGDGRPPSWWRQVALVLSEPMLLLLIAAGALSFLLAERLEASLLMASVLVVVGVTLFQERRTERALARLRELSAPRALVLRDGVQTRIPGREVVIGDILVVGEGDRVAADAVVIDSASLMVDESMLTGESAPVGKFDESGDEMLFAGTMVVRGHGRALVKSTGKHTEFGRIGEVLASVQSERTLLQREIGRLVRVVAVIGVITAIVVTVVYGATRGGWLNAAIAGIAVAMSMLPEEFPVVLAVFLALGAWRLSKHQVLARRVAVIEALGAATVICADKTGTLTTNKMTIDELLVDDLVVHPHDGASRVALRHLVSTGARASLADAHDPMDQAFRQLAEQWVLLDRSDVLVREYPLSNVLFAFAQVWDVGADQFEVTVKGAPETVVELCRLPVAKRDDELAKIHAAAERGQRVLAVARGSWPRESALPASVREIPLEYLGLVGLTDPLREGARAAVRASSQAGIRTVMITGDYPGTALAIARQAAIDTGQGVLSGSEIDQLSDVQLVDAVQRCNVFARTKPEQKLRLVRALQQSGEVVAMTGDGVNDAPALRAADIGVAMGGRGTDVAREAAALVITDDDYVSIVEGVRLGRGIYDNLRKALSYVVAVHVAIFGMALLPLFNTGWPLVLLPIQLALLELVIDPACSVVFEAESHDPDLMNQPPRQRNEHLFAGGRLIIAVLQGVVVFAVVATIYVWSIAVGGTDGQVRSLTFATLVLANLGLIMVNRSWRLSIVGTLRERRNASVKWILGATLTLLAVLLFLPVVRDAFNFGSVRVTQLVTPILAAGLSIVWFEAYKVLHRRIRPHR